MKAYLAAPFSTRGLLREYRKRLAAINVEVTSRWIDLHDHVPPLQAATEDLEDVRAADVLVAFSFDDYLEKGSGGRHVELGYALALGKPALLLGEPGNVFYALAERVGPCGPSFGHHVESYVGPLLARFEEMRRCGAAALDGVTPFGVRPLRDWQRVVHLNSAAKGFWDQSDNIPEKLALVHAEVSEALEEYRNVPPDAKDLCAELQRVRNSPPDRNLNSKPEGFGVELADAVIRLLDLAERVGVDLDVEVARKHAYNLTRPPLHGGKRA